MAQIKYFTADSLIEGKFTDNDYSGSVGEFIAEMIKPETPFTVYEGQPCLENDITFDSDGLPNIDYLLAANGEYVVIETPAATVGLQIAISIILSVVIIALTPKPELPQNVNRRQQSPNNALSARTNIGRPLQRIPDIKGKVLSIPDVIQPTYSTYENNLEIEHGFYCIGRKQYLVEEIKDGETPIDLISNASAGVYFPFNSPNLGAPDINVNFHFSEPVVSPYRSNQVNGIQLSPDFASGFLDATTLRFGNDPFFVNVMDIGSSIPYDSSYVVGEDLVLTNVVVEGQDISGTYRILVVNFETIVGDFLILVDFGGAVPLSNAGSFAISGTMQPETASEFTDWFYMTQVMFNSAIFNIVAPNGMYEDTGALALVTRSVVIQFQIEGVDAAGVPNGMPDTINETISGSTQNLVAKTVTFPITTPTRIRVRAKRTTPRFIGSNIVVDAVKFEDLYGIQDVSATDFGDVTTIQTRTVATPFATSAKERQLNCQSTEMLNVYEGSGVFNGSLTPNTRGVQSFIKDAIDPLIGNRQLSEIAADDLLALDAEIDAYFQSTKMGEFNYTFDSTEISFQEYTQTIFNAMFCIAFREAGQISALLERSQTIPAMLFTHRSKLPGSETQSRNTNPSTINDGVEFTYVDQTTNTSEVIYLPEDRSAVNPKKFDIAGIQNIQQALVRARREFNKLEFSKLTLEQTVTAEGRYLRPNDMFASVKGSRVLTFAGEVLAQNGLILTLDTDVTFGGGVHTIVLKDEDGKTESIVVTVGAETDEVILAAAPTQTIRTGIDSRRTEFSFGVEAVHLAERWLAQDIDISDNWFVQLTAINYDDNYYIDDIASVSAFSSGFSAGFS